MAKTPHPPESEKELEPLILDGISQILDQGRNLPKRNFKEEPLSHDEQLFIILNLHKELSDPKLHTGLVYLYGKILNFVEENILYN